MASTDTLGLVLTNWHVVRDAAAPPVVLFPDGFRSTATIARVDRDWDLAALVIWRPSVAPIPVASAVPRPGDSLAIAGYGKGDYRVDTGRCTQYLSPGRHHPYELVELAASARQGDSGGPIFNDRGELAGVLFGSAFGRTTGSHSGRVRQFLAPLWHDFYHQQPDANAMLASRPQPEASLSPHRPVASIQPPPSERSPAFPPPAAASAPEAPPHPADFGSVPSVVTPAPQFASAAGAVRPAPPSGHSGESAVHAGTPPPHGAAGGHWLAASPAFPEAATYSGSESAEFGASALDLTESHAAHYPSRSEQLKTILAVIGILAIVFHGIRLLGRAVEV